MSVDLEEDKASGKPGPGVHEEASDDEEASGECSVNDEESGERICFFFCDKNRKVFNYRAVPLHSAGVEKLRNDIFAVANACEDRDIEQKLEAVGVNGNIYYHNPCKTTSKKNVFKPVSDTEWHKKKVS